MRWEDLDEIIDLNPSAEQVRLNVQKGLGNLGNRTPDEVAAFCIDGLVEYLALTCVLRFDARVAAEPGTVRTVGQTGPFTLVLLFCRYLRDLWSRPECFSADRQLTVTTIGELLASLVSRFEEPATAVKPQLVAAYFISRALKNERDGKRPLEDSKEEVFIRAALYSELQSCKSALDVVSEVRRRLIATDS